MYGCFQRPLVLPGEGGGAGGGKDTQEQFAIQHLNAGAFFPPVLVRLGRGAD